MFSLTLAIVLDVRRPIVVESDRPSPEGFELLFNRPLILDLPIELDNIRLAQSMRPLDQPHRLYPLPYELRPRRFLG